MREWINLLEGIEANPETTTDHTTDIEQWGSKTVMIKFKRTVDPDAYQNRGGKMNKVTRIRATLMLGRLLVGGYETVEGSNKVTVYFGNGYKEKVDSEEAAKQFLLKLI